MLGIRFLHWFTKRTTDGHARNRLWSKAIVRWWRGQIWVSWSFETPQIVRCYLGRRGAKRRNVEKNIDAFAQVIQCLDDRSLSLVMRDAKDYGRKAWKILRNHYIGKSKQRVLSLYTEFTSLQKGHDEWLCTTRRNRSCIAEIRWRSLSDGHARNTCKWY